MKIYFPYLHKSYETDEQPTVAAVCAAVGQPLNMPCGGKGTCGKCLVTVRQNGLLQEVLGCVYRASDQMEILISAEDRALQILTTGNRSTTAVNPSIRLHTLMSDTIDFAGAPFMLNQLSTLIKEPILTAELSALQKLAAYSAQKEKPRFLNLILRRERLIDLVPADEKIHITGLAMDLGTTTLALWLYDLTTGALLGQASAPNPQGRHGADVIARIEYASGGAEQLQEMETLIQGAVASLTEELLTQADLPGDRIYQVVLSGNTTMTQLFFGLDPVALGRSPFVGVTNQSLTARGEETALPVNPAAEITALPALGGFVGGDTTAVLTSIPNDGKLRLIIDLGTNGELALGDGESYLVASTACGPALEGGGIAMGMRAEAGAIEKISLSNLRLKIQTIGNVPPIGLCGSGIVDAVSLLLITEVIGPDGAFIKDEGDHFFADRFGVDEHGVRTFTLVRAGEEGAPRDIVITQKDVRAIQMAVSAIATGIDLLLDEKGIAGEDLDEILVAGAFGNYIDPVSATIIGLLPDFPAVPVYPIGNAAGTGTQLYLLSQEKAELADRLPSVTKHVELATNPEFMVRYMKNMSFPEK